jgi:hypothetical protein
MPPAIEYDEVTPSSKPLERGRLGISIVTANRTVRRRLSVDADALVDPTASSAHRALIVIDGQPHILVGYAAAPDGAPLYLRVTP